MCHGAKFAQSEPAGKDNVRFKRLAEYGTLCDTSVMGVNLKELRKGRGWNQQELADRLSISKSHVSEMEAGIKNPSTPLLERMSSVFAIPMRDLFGSATEAVIVTASTAAATLISVYNVFASAGAGSLVGSEQIVDRLAFPPDYLRHITKTNLKFLQIIGVKGDSMYPTLKDDDIVMIDTSKTDLSYDGMFVFRDGGDALLVKRFNRGTTSETVMLVSDNKSLHPPVERRREDIDVVGKVIWRGVKE